MAPSEAGSDAVPRHLAVIMDGNGRWAKKRALPRSLGHRRGAEKLHDLCSLCIARGIAYLTVYAFSTENWRRPPREVNALMRLFVEFFRRYDEELEREGVRLRFAGDIAELPDEVRRTIAEAESGSATRTRLQLIIAFNYGGRRELVHATRAIAAAVARGELSPDAITEDTVRRHLYLPDVPDPDLIVRPSGEMRLSNFLLWQSAYAELYFDEVLWPDFSEEALDRALAAYRGRQRRYGGLS